MRELLQRNEPLGNLLIKEQSFCDSGFTVWPLPHYSNLPFSPTLLPSSTTNQYLFIKKFFSLWVVVCEKLGRGFEEGKIRNQNQSWGGRAGAQCFLHLPLPSSFSWPLAKGGTVRQGVLLSQKQKEGVSQEEYLRCRENGPGMKPLDLEGCMQV